MTGPSGQVETLMHRRSRRTFLQGMAGLGISVGGLAVLAGCGSSGGLPSAPAVGEPPPETRTLKIAKGTAGICSAPIYLAGEDLLREEGFTDVQFIGKNSPVETYTAIASGEIDISNGFSAKLITMLDAGEPIALLSGAHVGCFELFGTEQVRAIRDLKGKTVAVLELGGVDHLFLSSMLAYVGLNPSQDITWVTQPAPEAIRLLDEGKIDAYLAFPTAPQEIRARGIGHTVVSSAVDKPWSQYFCCMIASNKAFVEKHPVATKRMVRAILKAVDLCASEPERAAQMLVDQGYTTRRDYALQLMRDLPYARWREFDPEDTLRFWSLRLHEAVMIKSSPDQIIARGANWRFFNELKKELKA